MFNLAARSSIADCVIKQACWWLGARQARAAWAFTETDWWFFLRLGISVKTYGMGGMPPPVNPPVAQLSDCQAVMVPSFLAASLILA